MLDECEQTMATGRRGKCPSEWDGMGRKQGREGVEGELGGRELKGCEPHFEEVKKQRAGPCRKGRAAKPERNFPSKTLHGW